MTEELRQRANALHKQIEDLTNEIQLVEDMHHSGNNLYLSCSDTGAITIAGDEQLKDDLLDIILSRLNAKKEEVEDEYRML